MDLTGLKELLGSRKKIVITTHFKPDGDAIGSSLGMYNYLIQKGQDVTVVVPSDTPEFLHWMAGNNTVVDFEKVPETAQQLFNAAEIIFCLDFNRPDRIEGLTSFLEQSKAVKVLIDHHLEPHPFAEYMYSYSSASSTCELVYKFICNMGDKKLITKAVAECLYTGIMTDTGSFKFSTMLPETHRIIADLVEAGAENSRIHELVYDTSSEDRMRLLGYCLTEKLKIFPEYNTALISLSKAELNKYNHRTGDTEGIVNYPLAIHNIRLAAFFVERKDIIKISFRSKNDFSVRDLSAKHFEGGGHRNASGGSAKLSLQQTIDKFIALLPQYKDGLTK